MQPLGFVAAPALAPTRAPWTWQPVRGVNISRRACVFIVLAVHTIYAAFLFGIIKATSEPLPRGILNQTLLRFRTFQASTYIVGSLVGAIDVAPLYLYIRGMPRSNWLVELLVPFFGFPAVFGLWMLIGLLGSIISDIASKSTYAHACDSDWLEIVLTAHTWKTAANRNIATFSLAETHELLWTWTSNDPFQNDFNLVGLNSTSLSLLPSLTNVTINHHTNELERAWCYNTTNQCATGYVWPFDGLFFEVQFNGTLTRMRNRYRDWTFDNVPSVLMHRVDENGQLAERLMHTSVNNPSACRQIKVCVSHAMRRRAGVVDPDVLVAAYWLLHKQAIYARRCTNPK